MIKIYAAGISGGCSELAAQLSSSSDVDELYARYSDRFPQIGEVSAKVQRRELDPESLVRFIDQTYTIADPAVAAIPAGTVTGYDTWCPRTSDADLKYWDRVPLSAMVDVGYFNCLYGTALAARALASAASQCTLLLCPAVPTHPFLQLEDRPGELFSFNHDGLRCHRGQLEIRNRSYAPVSLMPISDYHERDGIYGLSIPEHFLIPTRLVPAAENVTRAIEAFDHLARGLDDYRQLAGIAKVIRLLIIPQLRLGPIPFSKTIDDRRPEPMNRDRT